MNYDVKSVFSDGLGWPLWKGLSSLKGVATYRLSTIALTWAFCGNIFRFKLQDAPSAFGTRCLFAHLVPSCLFSAYLRSDLGIQRQYKIVTWCGVQNYPPVSQSEGSQTGCPNFSSKEKAFTDSDGHPCQLSDPSGQFSCFYFKSRRWSPASL